MRNLIKAIAGRRAFAWALVLIRAWRVMQYNPTQGQGISIVNALGMAVGVAALLASTPATAVEIIYSVTGTSATGEAFSITGTGDTVAVFDLFGNSSVPTILLVSHSVTYGANTGWITGGDLYFFNNLENSVAGFNLNLTNDIFDVQSALFGTYNASSSIASAPMALSYTSSFVTSFGTVNLRGATDLSFESIIPSADALPEPGTWTMMLTGFGAIGYAMRRRRRATLTTKRA